jgi:MFS family permease
VFNLGAPLGTIVGLVIAGYVAEANLWGLGWRAPFYLFAIPGIILGILVLFTRDYPTDAQKTYRIDGQERGVAGAIVWMLRTPTLLFSYLGVAAMSFVGAALGHWLPTYFVRSRGIEVGAASLLMGGIIAASVFGPILGGAVADRWRKKKSTARPLTAGIIALISGILIYISFFIDIAGFHKAAYGFFIAVGVTMFAYAPPAYSISQDLVPRNLRSISMGTLVLVTYGTLAAYAPVVVGWLSDIFGTPEEPNLIAGFMAVPVVAFFGAFFFYMSNRYHDRDMKRFHS